jgi:hypothetical protein
MPLLTLRLTEDLDARLDAEAGVSRRSRSQIARDAIADYLRRTDRSRFLAEIARASRSPGAEDRLKIAAEALPLDNESLVITTNRSVRERRTAYRKKRPAKK